MAHESRFTRRDVLGVSSAIGLVLSLGSSLVAGEPNEQPKEPPKDAAGALTYLKDGNARFTENRSIHGHTGANWRKHLSEGQHPFATVLGCSDSRVPVELLFDAGFGDLFVVRVAGNVLSPGSLGSIAYAAVHLQTPLFIVLGHEKCGAVTAALDSQANKLKEPDALRAMLDLIEPAVKNVDTKLPPADLLHAAVEANVRWSVKGLTESKELKGRLKEQKFMLVGAVYDLDSGKVRFLE